MNSSTLSTIAAMRKQEDTCYCRIDPASSNSTLLVWRKRIVAWFCDLADYLQLQQPAETIEIAINYFDRFLVTPSGLRARQHRQSYQLAAITCLYTAAKIHEPEAIDPKLAAKLTKGAFTATEIEAMELVIVQALEWRLNPPTIMSFVRQFLDILPSKALSSLNRSAVHELCCLQAELAVVDQAFLSIKPSVLAFCAVMNAFESICMEEKLLVRVGNVLSTAIGMSNAKDELEMLEEVQDLLYEAVTLMDDSHRVDSSVTMTPSRKTESSTAGRQSPHSSPRCVRMR